MERMKFDNQNQMCRICSLKQHDEFESLFKDTIEDCVPALSELGEMYQSLFNLPINYNKIEPRHLCCYCVSQLVSLHKFRCRAFESFQQFTKITKINDSKKQNNSKQESSCNHSSSNQIQILNDSDTPSIKNEDIDEGRKCSTEETENLEIALENLNKNDNMVIKLEEDVKDNESKEDNGDSVDSVNNEDSDANEVLDDSEWEEEFLSEECPENEFNPSENFTIEIEKASVKDEITSTNDVTISDADSESEKQSKVVAKKKNAKNIVQCSRCLEIFDCKKQLRIHRKTQHSRKNLTCPTCLKIVHSEEALQVHKNIHNGLPAYKCDECDKTFKQKCHYTYHKAHHKNERNAVCSICDKGFLSKGDLKIHMRSHLDERRYQCDICDKSFRVSTHMKNHRFTHFGKQFECSTCFQMYVTPATLSTHIKTVHLKMMAYQCETCNKRFKRKHHLIAHYKTHKRSARKEESIKSLDEQFIEDLN